MLKVKCKRDFHAFFVSRLASLASRRLSACPPLQLCAAFVSRRMERDSDFQIQLCLEWRTGLPTSSTTCTSPAFSVHGADWCLRLSCSSGAIMRRSGYSLHLTPTGPKRSYDPTTPFSVATYARHPTHPDGHPVGWTRQEVTGRTSVLVWATGPDPDPVLRALDLVPGLAELRFVCLFHGAQPRPIGNLTGLGKCPNRTLEKSVQVSSEVPRDIESLSSDLSRLLDKEILPDVKLKCRDRTFQAHRSILVARSDVFRAMFQNETLESETGDVKIADMEVGVLEKLLKFVYTGRPDDLSEDCTSDLYEAADKYAVLSLKAACSYWIERNLAVENCVRYLKVADSHCDRDLKASVISFIVENPEVLKSESWLALSKELPVLANEVFQTYVASTVK